MFRRWEEPIIGMKTCGNVLFACFRAAFLPETLADAQPFLHRRFGIEKGLRMPLQELLRLFGPFEPLNRQTAILNVPRANIDQLRTP